jgi:two-component sensor histidine kinase
VERIALERRVDPIGLTLEQAVPWGLIIIELVSNALKHGFPDGRGGTVTVEINRDGERHIRLSVRDTGVGLPDGVDITNTKTLGLKLVSGLARQSDGELTYAGANSHGASFRVVFSASGEPGRESN